MTTKMTTNSTSSRNFQRVFEYLWDPEPSNTDYENPIVVLGQTYSPLHSIEEESISLNEGKLVDDGLCSSAGSLSNSISTMIAGITSGVADKDGGKSGDTGKAEINGMPGTNSNNDTVPENNDDPTNVITPIGVPSSASTSRKTTWPDPFVDDVESRIWMTYRQGFPLIERAPSGPSPVGFKYLLRGAGSNPRGFTSDTGWGCMIRTAQSLLANALMNIQFGRDWRISKASGLEEKVIRMFVDDPRASFSLHKYVSHGQLACGKLPGEWFGPSAAASSIRQLCLDYNQARMSDRDHDSNDNGNDNNNDDSTNNKNKMDDPTIHVYLSSGSDVYENELLAVATNNHTTGFEPTLVLFAIRLGIDKVNPVYWDGLKFFLGCRQSVGIAGGRPESSHYFYGYQGEYLFYLDPHHTQSCLRFNDDGQLDAKHLQTVHTRRIRKLHLNDLDPSMLIGILLLDQRDWENWSAEIRARQARKGCIVSISQRAPINLRRSSISVGSEDGDFVDVALEQTTALDSESDSMSLSGLSSGQVSGHNSTHNGLMDLSGGHIDIRPPSADSGSDMVSRSYDCVEVTGTSFGSTPRSCEAAQRKLALDSMTESECMCEIHEEEHDDDDNDSVDGHDGNRHDQDDVGDSSSSDLDSASGILVGCDSIADGWEKT